MEGFKIRGKGMEGDDDELKMLLDEIPNVTSSDVHHHRHRLFDSYNDNYNHNHVHGETGYNGGSMPYATYGKNDNDDKSRHCNYVSLYGSSPLSVLPLQSNGFSSSLFSGGQCSSVNGPPTPPLLEEVKSHVPCGSSRFPNGPVFGSTMVGFPGVKKVNESFVDGLGLCRSVNKMCIRDGDSVSLNSKGSPLHGQSKFGMKPDDIGKSVIPDKLRERFSGVNGVQIRPSASSIPPRHFDEVNSRCFGSQNECGTGNLLQSRPLVPPSYPEVVLSQINQQNWTLNFLRQKTVAQANMLDRGGRWSPNLATLRRPPNTDAFSYPGQNALALNEEELAMHLYNLSEMHHARQEYGMGHSAGYGLQQASGRTRDYSNIRIPPGKFEAMENSVIIQGEGINCRVNKGFSCSKDKGLVGAGKRFEGGSKADGRARIAGGSEKSRSSLRRSPFSMPLKFKSLAEARGYIYLIAKDQQASRFLQQIFEEGTQEDVQIIFDEIIDHVVELMVNPFGNYLIQKLLDVCNEEQKMHILLIVTEEPGELVRISLNNFGTRVVQKLIETLSTKQQISMVISALEPGFLALIKDLNGNHVVQRCLEQFSTDDNKFIFAAAAKHCVDIATHQHGCCVLQRCISFSTEEHLENLITEISSNGLLLAQDAYGNYVVQYILELKNPLATSNLTSQFEGSYASLSTQKCGSHVVEKCLLVFEPHNRSRIIHELLATARFERLIQDPHANYVIQRALQVSQGSLYRMLAERIESYRATLRNCPHSKKIYSQKLLKK